MKKALFLSGGWPGHQPEQIVQLFTRELTSTGLFDIVTETDLEILSDARELASFALIFPCWTMGALTPEQSLGLRTAVHGGVGLGGIHGGMGDAFRGDLDYEWMVGGHFVGHPHVGDYTVRVRDFASPIMSGVPHLFPYHSEQYYMMIDPSVHVLADSEYVYEGRACTMPVVWIRPWGKGRVFYSALGHAPDEFEKYPHVRELTVRGLLWASRLSDL